MTREPTAIEELADLVSATRAGSVHRPTGTRRSHPVVVVGISGPIASGKSTLAAELAAVLDARHRLVAAVVSADGFLFPNDVLVARGTDGLKGWPETYDSDAIVAFLRRVRAGDAGVVAPVYSHLDYDVVAGTEPIGMVDVVVVEGVVVLQPGVADELDLGVYIDVEAEDLRRWYVERFVALVAELPDGSSSILSLFRGLDEDPLREAAVGVWEAMNVPNHLGTIEPTRSRADVVVALDGDHRIARLERIRRRSHERR